MYYIYKTINTLNDRYYIGKHKGNLADKYFGSGVRISSAIKKYGKENFKKEILKEGLTEENIDYWEEYFIQPCLEDPLCYNIAPGGEGGHVTKHYTPEQKRELYRRIKTKRAETIKNTDPKILKNRSDRQTASLLLNIENHKQAIRKGLAARNTEEVSAQHQKVTQAKLKKGYYSIFQLIDPDEVVVLESIGAEQIAKEFKVSANGIRAAANHTLPISRGNLKGYKVVRLQ